MNAVPFALSAIKRHWKLILVGLALAAFTVQTLRLAASKAETRAEQQARLADQESYRRAQAEAQSKALAQRAKDEAEYQEKADAADAQIDDLRDRLRARLLRPQADQGGGGRALAQAQGDDPGLPQEVPAAAPVDRRSVQVDADVLAGLAAYAIAAHDWALSLGE